MQQMLGSIKSTMTRTMYLASFEKVSTVFSWSLLRLLIGSSQDLSRFSYNGAASALSGKLNESVVCDPTSLAFAMQSFAMVKYDIRLSAGETLHVCATWACSSNECDCAFDHHTDGNCKLSRQTQGDIYRSMATAKGRMSWWRIH